VTKSGKFGADGTNMPLKEVTDKSIIYYEFTDFLGVIEIFTENTVWESDVLPLNYSRPL